MKSNSSDSTHVTSSPSPHGHHRHRRWYKRWWRNFVKDRRSLTIVIIVAVIIAAIFLGLLIARANLSFSGPRRPPPPRALFAVQWYQVVDQLA